MMCMADTDIGDKSKAAMQVCGDGSSDRSLDRKGKGKGCPTADAVIQEELDKYSWEMCMFAELGWIDSDGAPVEETIQADIETLPSEMSESLLGDNFDTCVSDTEAKMEKKIIKKHKKKCFKKFSDEEVATMYAVLNGVARTDCFMKISKESCGDYVMNLVDSMAEGSNSGSGSA